jgi:site-specific recombinase XerD
MKVRKCRESLKPIQAPKLGQKKNTPKLETLIKNLFMRIGLTDKESKVLEQDIRDYRHWMESTPHRENSITKRYAVGVSDLLSFIRNKELGKKNQFAPDHAKHLFGKGKSDQPSKNRKPQIRLPDIYEQYLLYHKQSLQVSDDHAKNVRRVLTYFHEYLNRDKIALSALKIEHLDAFMGEFELALSTRRVYRHHLRGFLKYLYHDGGIIKKDLATFLVGPPMFAESTPPKFLRPEEVKRLFSSLRLSTPAEIRTYAIVHLSYTLGLRPVEITRITLDDISFQKGELTLPDRKADNPITLPVPENTLKAIAAYVLKARPKSPNRHIFLSCYFPYEQMSSSTVVVHLSRIMKKAGLPASGYWLRHTYAQNLLETGRSIYEIKEMLGHQSIQSSHRYIYIHTELMRKVLFNETL